jgi:hypothetical protein
MVREFRRRFLWLALAGWIVGGIILAPLAGIRMALAFGATFLIVAGDFLWMSYGLERLMGSAESPRGVARWFLVGLAFRTLLLLLGVYVILRVLPRESLGVILGIGGPLILLAAAGAFPTRG